MNDEFKNELMQRIQEDEDYANIVQQLQDPAQTNEVCQWGKKFRIKRGTLKIHEEGQSPTYEYWRTVLQDR